MKPRPFYRWKSFWLGLFVLVFLGWAWAQSRNAYGGVSFSRTSGLYAEVSQEWGYVLIVGAIMPGGDYGFASWSTPLPSDEADLYPLFPAAISSHETENSRNTTVAHWFLILLFLIPWVGFLAWRVRKQRKR